MGRPKSRSTNSAHGRSTVEPYKDLDLHGGSSVGHTEAGAAGRGPWGRLNSDASTGINGAAAKAASANAGAQARKVRSGSESGTSPVPVNTSTGTLEARFGSGLFGRKKKGQGGGANVPPGGTSNKSLTSSQQRAMYPGLSIASTQNDSMGVVSIPVREDGGIDRDVAPTAGARPVDDPAPGGVISRYRDAKRREAREDAVQGSDPRHSFTTDTGTAASSPQITEHRREISGRRGPDLR